MLVALHPLQATEHPVEDLQTPPRNGEPRAWGQPRPPPCCEVTLETVL